MSAPHFEALSRDGSSSSVPSITCTASFWSIVGGILVALRTNAVTACPSSSASWQNLLPQAPVPKSDVSYEDVFCKIWGKVPVAPSTRKCIFGLEFKIFLG